MSVEIGGMNSMVSLCVGAEFDLPVLDCDCMGRAFPELQMITPAIYGANVMPLCMTEDKGYQWILTGTQGDNVKEAELFMRKNIFEISADGSLVGAPLSKDFLLKFGVKYSMSRIWKLGRAIVGARQKKFNPLKVIEEKEGGHLLFIGKVIDVHRRLEGGFNKGVLKIHGMDDYSGKTLLIDFQNENLIATLVGSEPSNKRVVAVVPDLISIVDCETYEPISTDEIKYGLRVAVLLLPISPILSSPEALLIVGPKAFGYDIEFQTLGKYITPVSILHEDTGH